uniref:RPEL repeat protein n=1 Tax=Loa loa TaxID=7209 RepID=A0A1I7V888_LOALO
MDLTPLNQFTTGEETRQQQEARNRITEEKILRLKLHIGNLKPSILDPIHSTGSEIKATTGGEKIRANGQR